MRAGQEQHIPFDSLTTWTGILWTCPSMFTKLAGYGECMLALFHAIRIFL